MPVIGRAVYQNPELAPCADGRALGLQIYILDILEIRAYQFITARFGWEMCERDDDVWFCKV